MSDMLNAEKPGEWGNWGGRGAGRKRMGERWKLIYIREKENIERYVQRDRDKREVEERERKRDIESIRAS